jgi:hypothetical protein
MQVSTVELSRCTALVAHVEVGPAAGPQSQGGDSQLVVLAL